MYKVHVYIVWYIQCQILYADRGGSPLSCYRSKQLKHHYESYVHFVCTISNIEHTQQLHLIFVRVLVYISVLGGVLGGVLAPTIWVCIQCTSCIYISLATSSQCYSCVCSISQCSYNGCSVVLTGTSKVPLMYL